MTTEANIFTGTQIMVYAMLTTYEIYNDTILKFYLCKTTFPKKLGQHCKEFRDFINSIKTLRECGEISVNKEQGQKPILNGRDLQALRHHWVKTDMTL